MSRFILPALLLALVDPRPAEACSCSDLAALQVPASGSVNVPLDAQLLFRPPSTELEGLETGEPKLRSSAGEVAATVSSFHDDFSQLVPAELLAADTTYEVVWNGRVSGTFTTSSFQITEPPLTPDIYELELQVAPISGSESSCVGDDFEFVTTSFSRYPTTGAFLVSYDASGGTGGAGEQLVLPADLERLDGAPQSGCGRIGFPVERGTEGCMTIRAVSLDGQISAPTTRCAAVETCASTDWDDGVCRPDSGGCRIGSGGESGAWLALVALAITLRRRRR